MDINNAKSRVEELTNLLNYHNNLYYNQDNPEISDYEYDKLLREWDEEYSKSLRDERCRIRADLL